MENTLTTIVEARIFNFRGIQVMLDSDLAELYGVSTKALNQAFKRNKERFPASFAFTLEDGERVSLRSQIVTLENRASIGKGTHSKYAPTVYSEFGIAMLSAVLKSDKAVAISIEIIEVFVRLRRNLFSGNLVLQRIDTMEKKMLGYDMKFDEINRILEFREPPKHGIFFNNQIFDAYVFFSELVQKATSSIILIDNYIDHTVLLQLAKRAEGVSATIYTERIPAALDLDLEKHNAQYPVIEIHRTQHIHDRFLIIDQKELYHIGASVKDLGKKWFAFSKMDSLVSAVLRRVAKW